ncbi:hypothetical protein FT641_04210 [Bacillus paranthracis]|uniref:hypothetical protein n=1 Tax=Bacillus TaxID=1386 RepID=UPI0018796FB8|nr:MULTISPECIES: hypothetical protein [Bacillus cereus group]MBE7117903.1 hypothetical protein [Bacillus paranthracis]MBE7135326.1 hypothetical protein [Bacillus paranthracis]MBE7151915.1 hypothetical protein [Bacillus paranthracis]MCC2375556.1 hypothetical protein [Bacillus paranthracis]MCX3322840.1 hypothetical protein [Bacillus paranthracis]
MICLFRFELKNNKIDFILNNKIEEVITPYHNELLQPLITSLGQILYSYHQFSKHSTILSCQVSGNKQLEIILGKGLGQYIDINTREEIFFGSGKSIADILMRFIDFSMIMTP